MMNERLNELRLDAGIGRLHEVPYMVAVNKEGEIIDPLVGLEKFAELIVRECIAEFEKYTTVDYASLRVKEHFGINVPSNKGSSFSGCPPEDGGSTPWVGGGDDW